MSGRCRLAVGSPMRSSGLLRNGVKGRFALGALRRSQGRRVGGPITEGLRVSTVCGNRLSEFATVRSPLGREFGAPRPRLVRTTRHRWRAGGANYRPSREIPCRHAKGAIDVTPEYVGYLLLEFLSGNDVHSPPGTFKSAIPCRKSLAVAKRIPDARGTRLAKVISTAPPYAINQARRTPVPAAARIGKISNRNCPQTHPMGNAAIEPVAVPQSLCPECLYLEQRRRVAAHDPVHLR